MAVLRALQAMGLEPFEAVDEPIDHGLPRRPFDPVLSLVLAGYAFYAYHDPPRSAYYELFASRVKGSAISGKENLNVYTQFAYVDVNLMRKRADGLFMVDIREVKGFSQDGYLVGRVNSAVVADLTRGKGKFSVLRMKEGISRRIWEVLGDEKDELVFGLWLNKRHYEEGVPPVSETTLSLSDLVSEGLEKRETVHGEKVELQFAEGEFEEKERDFFQFSMLPKELIGLLNREENSETKEEEEKQLKRATINVQVTFVPFPKQTQEAKANAVKSDAEQQSLLWDTNSSPISVLQTALLGVRDLPKGEMPKPQDWNNLANVARSVTQHVGDLVGFENTKCLTENLPGSLFIESLATDTEAWLFHDEAKKVLVISFRGTEQVSWRDFFTDAQAFLQRWTPGEEIILDIESERTVGLADFVPSVLPTSPASIPDDSSAVHYGFLRAYLSIRDAILRAINLLTSDLEDGYSLYFTGHSLGGALATLASADFQARHMYDNIEVCCMSFGAPKAGNLHFSRIYNRLVPNSFRIVNDADLVSRMPRSLPSGTHLGRYKHAGRTVLVNNDGDFWIEGHVQEEEISKTGFDDPFRDRYKNLQDLIAFEQRLWSELLSGQSLQNHMVSLTSSRMFVLNCC